MADNHHLWPRFQASMQHVDRVTYDKIQRHLADINDRITEDDIRNVKIGITSENTAYTASGKNGSKEADRRN